VRTVNGAGPLTVRRMGVDAQRERVVYMHAECPACRSEGFEAMARVRVSLNSHSLVALLHIVHGDLVAPGEVGLSEAAWFALGAREGDTVRVSHPETVESMRHVRAKIFGRRLGRAAFAEILADAVEGRLTDVDLTAFIVASARSLSTTETTALTRAMVDVGEHLDWGRGAVADKHSVGGLPGNRTTMIIVPILAAAGALIPKTSSRAITSPAGTADTMETLAPVDLDLAALRRTVEATGGCIAWGGAMRLSPADDVMVRIERALDIDSSGQLVASVLSKKKAAGSTHVVIDMPIGPTAKVRDAEAAASLQALLQTVGERIGLHLRVVWTDGSQPVGRGIGPALEARDVLSVLQNQAGAPADLRSRALTLAGPLIELVGLAAPGEGQSVATAILADGRAWAKFQAIAEAQGGMRTPPTAPHVRPVAAPRAGLVTGIDNRRLARIAKLAGAPRAKAAGIDFFAPPGRRVAAGEPLFAVHAETSGELAYALDYAARQRDVVVIEDEP
jgi:thymidine phosphorylase